MQWQRAIILETAISVHQPGLSPFEGRGHVVGPVPAECHGLRAITLRHTGEASGTLFRHFFVSATPGHHSSLILVLGVLQSRVGCSQVVADFHIEVDITPHDLSARIQPEKMATVRMNTVRH